MKNSRIFAAASAFVLVAVSLFAAKAAKKFGTVTAASYKASGTKVAFSGATSILSTVKSTNYYTAIFQSGSTAYQLYTSGGTKDLYIKPL